MRSKKRENTADKKRQVAQQLHESERDLREYTGCQVKFKVHSNNPRGNVTIKIKGIRQKTSMTVSDK